MSCEHVQRRLTAYLDGELDGDRGSVVRGHLRACAACRQVATDEAALRDGLRALPAADPPPSLWAGVQAQLAADEIADAQRPAWRRALARWAPRTPRMAAGGLLAAAAVTVLWWRWHRADDRDAAGPVATAPVASAQVFEADRAPVAPTMPADDVTADLAAEAARTTARYADVADELVALAGEARGQWPADRAAAFDVQLAALRADVDRAAAGRPRQRAWQRLIRFLQGAVVRDEIALAGGGQ